MTLVMVLALSSGIASAQAARQLFDEGAACLKRGDHACAREKLGKSGSLAPSAATWSELSVAEEQLSLPHAALGHMREALALLPTGDPKRSAFSARIEALDAKVPRITLRGARKGAVIRLDGAALSESETAVPLLVEPGSHQIEVAGASPRVVSIGVGERRVVEIGDGEATPRPSGDAGPPPGPEATTSPPYLAYGLLGVGAVGAGVGVYSWLDYRSKKAAFDRDCTGASRCVAADLPGQRTTYVVVNAAAWTVGLAGVGIGTYLLLTRSAADRPATEVGLSPVVGPRDGGLVFHGRFQ